DSHEQMVGLTETWSQRAAQAGERGMTLMGDSAGGGYALAIAQTMRDRAAGGSDVAPVAQMVLHAPWADLTTSAPGTEEASFDDPWLMLSRIRLYAEWWAGGPDDLTRPEVSPALGDLRGLPPTLMFHGTRDTLAPGCRLLAQRAAEAGWDLTSIEEPGPLPVYSILPVGPEGRGAKRRVLDFRRRAPCRKPPGTGVDSLCDLGHTGCRRRCWGAEGGPPTMDALLTDIRESHRLIEERLARARASRGSPDPDHPRDEYPDIDTF